VIEIDEVLVPTIASARRCGQRSAKIRRAEFVERIVADNNWSRPRGRMRSRSMPRAILAVLSIHCANAVRRDDRVGGRDSPPDGSHKLAIFSGL